MTVAGGAAGAALWPGLAGASERERTPPLHAGATVLFQGDSITDVGRNRNAGGPNDPGALGSGYPLLIASEALRAHPALGLRFFNRGISGNKVPELQARWDADAVELRPDILSILIGVNDYWHARGGRYSGTVADYERGYTALLEDTRRRLPEARVVVMEPFVLQVGAVDASWYPEFDQRRAAAKRVAESAGALWVPLQDMFHALAERVSPEYWLHDGVHPTPAGHAAIAAQWRERVGL